MENNCSQDTEEFKITTVSDLLNLLERQEEIDAMG